MGGVGGFDFENEKNDQKKSKNWQFVKIAKICFILEIVQKFKIQNLTLRFWNSNKNKFLDPRPGVYSPKIYLNKNSEIPSWQKQMNFEIVLNR